MGLILAKAAAEPEKLPADFLMVERKLATRALGERARLHGLAVHAWTINDPAHVAPLVVAGVSNLITDDAPRLRAELAALRALGPGERALSRMRKLLGR